MSTIASRKKAKALRYGMTKVVKGQKIAWLSQENKNGWSLGLALASKTVWLRNTRFASKAEVIRATKGGVVFVPVKG